MQQAEFDKILADHEKWRNSKGKEGKRADGADLRQFGLRAGNMRFSDLSDAELKDVMRNGNLSFPDLSRARLSDDTGPEAQ